MPSGKVKYDNVNAGTGKPKSQGGGSTGKRTVFKAPKPADLIKSTGTPADKGVNR